MHTYTATIKDAFWDVEHEHTIAAASFDEALEAAIALEQERENQVLAELDGPDAHASFSDYAELVPVEATMLVLADDGLVVESLTVLTMSMAEDLVELRGGRVVAGAAGDIVYWIRDAALIIDFYGLPAEAQWLFRPPSPRAPVTDDGSD